MNKVISIGLITILLASVIVDVSAGRYYSLDLRQFTQPDPVIPDIYNPQALNRYAYAYNNPIRYNDPDGHTPWDVVDIGMFLYDAKAYWNDRSTDNRNNLALSAVGLAPVIPNPKYAKLGLKYGDDALKAGRSLKAANRIDNAVDVTRAASAVNRIDDVYDAAKVPSNLRGIQSYGEWRKVTKGSGFEVHHIVEQRFRVGSQLDAPSIVLDRKQHQMFTNKWNEVLPRGGTYTREQVLNNVDEVYKGYPEIQKAARGWIEKSG